MKTGIVSRLFPELGRPVILGDYPYYRAAPHHWPVDLTALAAAGIDCVTFYVPWRFHELSLGEFDFDGRTDPQRDVRGLLGLIASLGLKAIVKPGPFIHAEVQLGGLPDRLCRGGEIRLTDVEGRTVTSQNQPLPSLWHPTVRAEVADWMRAVCRDVIAPSCQPPGCIVGVQIGNEGIYSDANLPMARCDGSPFARQAFVDWLGRTDAADAPPMPYPVEWARWSGAGTVQLWDWLADFLPADIRGRTLVNIPLANACNEASINGWGMRQLAFDSCRHVRGHTEWIGNAAAESGVFESHLLGVSLGGTDIVEANWGFTWTDASFADPSIPLFHALLGLMLGSQSCSVYTACATQSWGATIAMDEAGLRAEGVDPAWHVPPYCPGAPLQEGGAKGATAAGLALLGRFVSEFGGLLLRTRTCIDAILALDRPIPMRDTLGGAGVPLLAKAARLLRDSLAQDGRHIAPCWADAVQPDEGVPVIHLVAQPHQAVSHRRTAANIDEVRSRLATALPAPGLLNRLHIGRHREGVMIRRRGIDHTAEFLGFFNPSQRSETFEVNDGQHIKVVTLAPHGCAVLVVEDHAVIGGLLSAGSRFDGAPPDADGVVWRQLAPRETLTDDRRTVPA
ncbi:beta-galactosidase [Bradyrhizobium jicamae]|uniref:beta-galactosidase n=1 Tax=Bradyrhizobium jicamae TaxID=280332 RepID=UPI001BABC501|nr:beta-galactosidase [Bradyrhizobium jicamae]MBR0939209.1 beta-galactosidase [Bradyrhizobium jicamae]